MTPEELNRDLERQLEALRENFERTRDMSMLTSQLAMIVIAHTHATHTAAMQAGTKTTGQKKLVEEVEKIVTQTKVEQKLAARIHRDKFEAEAKAGFTRFQTARDKKMHEGRVKYRTESDKAYWEIIYRGIWIQVLKGMAIVAGIALFIWYIS